MYCVAPLRAKEAHSVGQLGAEGFTTQQTGERVVLSLIPSWFYCHPICAELISGRDILQRKRKGTVNNFGPGVVSSCWGRKRLSASNSKADFVAPRDWFTFPVTVSLVMFLSFSLFQMKHFKASRDLFGGSSKKEVCKIFKAHLRERNTLWN